MNSIIQLMYNIPILVKYVMEISIDNNLDDNIINCIIYISISNIVSNLLPA